MLSRQRLLYILAFLVCAVFLLHGVALAFSLYWHFWWYDLVLHFLGGSFAALLALWVCYFTGYVRLRPPTRFAVFCLMLIGTLVIGVGWEVFERVLGHTWSPEGYWLDTGIDLLMDMSGGFLGFLFVSKQYKKGVSQTKVAV